jgi:hypothetical protein
MKIAVSRNLTPSSAELSLRHRSIQERRHRFLDDVWGRSVVLKKHHLVLSYLGH